MPRRVGSATSSNVDAIREPTLPTSYITIKASKLCAPPAPARSPSRSPSGQRPSDGRPGGGTAVARRTPCGACGQPHRAPTRSAGAAIRSLPRPGKCPRPVRRRGQGLEQLSHEIAAAVVEPCDLAALQHDVLRGMLGGNRMGPHAGNATLGDHPGMAYDEDLANRIRELIATEKGVTEKKMFGGLAFLIDGNMSV